MPTIFKLVFYSSANFKLKFRRDGHITGIEQTVDITTQQKTVAWLVGASTGIWANMCCFKRRQRPFEGHGATSLIVIRHENPECTLPKPGTHKLGFTKARTRICHP